MSLVSSLGASGNAFANVCPANDKDPNGMRAIPGGQYTVGSAASPMNPERKTKLSPFCIDVTEMTFEHYRSCVSGGQCSPAPLTDASCSADRRDMMPVACITWAEARAACAYDHKRLPTSEEWEAAAAGGVHLQYPITLTGPLPVNQVIYHFHHDPLHIPQSDILDLSASLVDDMGGNVSEWTSSMLGPNRFVKLVHGGSYSFVEPKFAMAVRALGMASRAPDVGVRCVISMSHVLSDDEP